MQLATAESSDSLWLNTPSNYSEYGGGSHDSYTERTGGFALVIAIAIAFSIVCAAIGKLMRAYAKARLDLAKSRANKNHSELRQELASHIRWLLLFTF